MKINKHLGAVLAFSPLLLLSGCDWVKEKLGMGKVPEATKKEKKKGKKIKTPKGEWVVKLQGETVVTPEEFEKEINLLSEERPQLKSMFAYMPNLEKDLARGMGNREAISHFIKDKKIDEQKEYISKKERVMNAAMQILDAEFFSKSFETGKVSDADVKLFYEDNKDTVQGLLISRGGVEASGVSFDKKADAQAFLEKAKKEKNLDLQKLAKENNLDKKFRDFKLVSEQSFGIDPVLRTKVLDVKTFPTVDIMSIGDKKFWVVHAPKKEETKYRPFDQVKDGIRQLAEQTERTKLLQKELDKLSKAYDVEVNETYFEKKSKKVATEKPVSLNEVSVPIIADAPAEAAQSKLPKTKTA